MTMSQMTLREYLRGFQSMEHNSIYLKSSEYLQHNCKYEWDRMKYKRFTSEASKVWNATEVNIGQ